MSKKTEKYRKKQLKKATKRVEKTAKQALKGKKGKNITDVIKKRDEEQTDFAKVFAPTYTITDSRKRSKKSTASYDVIGIEDAAEAAK